MANAVQMALFKAPELKLARAKKHLAELDDLISAYLASSPVKHEMLHTPPSNGAKNGSFLIRSSWQGIPEEFGAIAGDVIHNLRACLDLLANDLVRAAGASTKDVYFPICNEARDLEKMIAKRNFHRAGPAMVDELRALKPYTGGNIALRALHDLDIQDKHQMLMPTNLQFSGPPFRLARGDQDQITISVATESLTVTEVRLLFPDDGPLPGEDIVPTLHALVEMTAGILAAFKARAELEGVNLDQASQGRAPVEIKASLKSDDGAVIPLPPELTVQRSPL